MTLIVSPLRHVAEIIESRRPSHVLTLTAPDAAAPAFESIVTGQHLVLRFNDIGEPRDGLIAPDVGMIQSILDFGVGWDRRVPMLIHCYAGISRSTAAAYILACRAGTAGCEERVAIQLRHLSPTATPNPLMIAIADGLLKRGGRMVAAIAAIGRGSDAFEGDPFNLEP